MSFSALKILAVVVCFFAFVPMSIHLMGPLKGAISTFVGVTLGYLFYELVLKEHFEHWH
jgi:hypothetical protein